MRPSIQALNVQIFQAAAGFCCPFHSKTHFTGPIFSKVIDRKCQRKFLSLHIVGGWTHWNLTRLCFRVQVGPLLISCCSLSHKTLLVLQVAQCTLLQWTHQALEQNEFEMQFMWEPVMWGAGSGQRAPTRWAPLLSTAEGGSIHPRPFCAKNKNADHCMKRNLCFMCAGNERRDTCAFDGTRRRVDVFKMSRHARGPREINQFWVCSFLRGRRPSGNGDTTRLRAYEGFWNICVKEDVLCWSAQMTKSTKGNLWNERFAMAADIRSKRVFRFPGDNGLKSERKLFNPVSSTTQTSHTCFTTDETRPHLPPLEAYLEVSAVKSQCLKILHRIILIFPRITLLLMHIHI